MASVTAAQLTVPTSMDEVGRVHIELEVLRGDTVTLAPTQHENNPGDQTSP